MAGICDGYTREMYHEFGHFACWLPNAKVALGDVGTLRGHRFERPTSLAELGESFVEDVPSVAGDLEYATAGQLVVDATLADQTAVSITFIGDGATSFQASACVWTRMTALPTLEKQLLNLPEWLPDCVVVTKLLRAGPAVVLVSSEEGARGDVRVSAEALAGSVPIAKASAGLSVAGKSSLAARVAVSEAVTPLFHALRLRRRRLRRRANGSPSAPNQSDRSVPSALTTMTWDEYAG